MGESSLKYIVVWIEIVTMYHDCNFAGAGNKDNLGIGEEELASWARLSLLYSTKDSSNR